MSRILKMFISLTLFFSISSLSLQSVIAKDDIKVFYNTEEVIYGEHIIMKDGRAYIPIRLFADKYGYKVKWDNERKVTTLVKNQDEIILSVGKDIFTRKNSVTDTYKLHAPVQLINDRTYVPITTIEIITGHILDVRWDFQNKDIYLSTTKVNLIPSDFETGKYNKELRNVEGFGKPTVTYEKFIALAKTKTKEDIKFLFAQEGHYDEYGIWMKDFLDKSYYPESLLIFDRSYYYFGDKIPKTNYPEITKDNYDLIKEGMTYEEVEEILGGPGALTAYGIDYDDTMIPIEYQWVNEDKGGTARIRFERKDGISVVSRFKNDWSDS